MAFRNIADAGFRYIELSSAHCDYNTLTNALVDNIAHEIGRAGLQALSYYPQDAQEQWTRMPRMFEVAQRVGAASVVVPCPNLSKAKQLEPLCEKLGIDLAIANRWPFPFGRPSDYRSLDGSVGPRIGAAPDVGWFAAGGQDPLEMFDVVADRIKVVRLKDVAAEGEYRPVDLGAGVAPLEQFMAQLVAHGFDGPVTIESDTGQVIRFTVGLFGDVTYDVAGEPMTDEQIMEGLRRARQWALAHGAVP